MSETKTLGSTETALTADRRMGQDAMEIDLVALFRHLLHRWYMIVAAGMVCALAMGLYTHYFIKPVYKSTAKLYIVSASGDSVVNLTDLNLGTNLTNDYKELIMNYPVLDQVISALGLDMNSTRLASMITLNTPANTRVLSITVSSHDPDLSMNIANTLAGVAMTYLPETMSTPAPNVAQVARRPEGPSSPSLFRNVVLGGLVGALAVAAILTVLFLVNDAVQTEEDIENNFGVTVLTCVPDFSEKKHFGEYGYGYGKGYGYGYGYGRQTKSEKGRRAGKQ